MMQYFVPKSYDQAAARIIPFGFLLLIACLSSIGSLSRFLLSDPQSIERWVDYQTHRLQSYRANGVRVHRSAQRTCMSIPSLAMPSDAILPFGKTGRSGCSVSFIHHYYGLKTHSGSYRVDLGIARSARRSFRICSNRMGSTLDLSGSEGMWCSKPVASTGLGF
jgi:hypothetical protein